MKSELNVRGEQKWGLEDIKKKQKKNPKNLVSLTHKVLVVHRINIIIREIILFWV